MLLDLVLVTKYTLDTCRTYVLMSAFYEGFMFARDLSGRRVRHALAHERMEKWVEKKKEADELVEKLKGDEKDVKTAKHKEVTLDKK
jgi:hypothetical protein